LSRIRNVALAGVLASLVVAPAAIAGTSHVKLFQNSAKSAVCGLMVKEKGHPQFILCSAAGIPKPKHGCIGDPGFADLSAHGNPQKLCLSQDSFVPGKFVTLKAGSKWSRAGVTCTLAAKGKTVTCKNQSHHGFTIGNKKYKPF
jgi:hypothetical protein